MVAPRNARAGQWYRLQPSQQPEGVDASDAIPMLLCSAAAFRFSWVSATHRASAVACSMPSLTVSAWFRRRTGTRLWAARRMSSSSDAAVAWLVATEEASGMACSVASRDAGSVARYGASSLSNERGGCKLRRNSSVRACAGVGAVASSVARRAASRHVGRPIGWTGELAAWSATSCRKWPVAQASPCRHADTSFLRTHQMAAAKPPANASTIFC